MSAVREGVWLALAAGIAAYLVMVGWVIVHEVRRPGLYGENRAESGASVGSGEWWSWNEQMEREGLVIIRPPRPSWVHVPEPDVEGDVYMSCGRCGAWWVRNIYLPGGNPDVSALEHEAECPGA